MYEKTHFVLFLHILYLSASIFFFVRATGHTFMAILMCNDLSNIFSNS